jgi:hypothetical protein
MSFKMFFGRARVDAGMASDVPYFAEHQTVEGMAVALVWLFGTLCSHGV